MDSSGPENFEGLWRKGVVRNGEYNTDRNNLVEDFYTPVLRIAKKYDRTTGSFSISGIKTLARPLLPFIRNSLSSNSDKPVMRIVASHDIPENEYDEMLTGYDERFNQTERDLISIIEKLRASSDEELLQAIRSIGTMIRLNLLDIKIAVPKNKLRGMYHRKIGIFEDVFGDQITFEGSQNVTFSGEGGIQNLEGFVAFCSNDPAIETYKTEHRQFFDSLWNDALENVRVRPLGEYPRELLAGYGVSAEKLLEGSKATEKEIRLAPLPHQEKAVQGWLAHNRRGILDMCTGSGKSRAALMALETIEESPFTIVVTGNLTDLIDQWAENQIIPYYGRERVALLRISSVHGIRSRMELKLSEMVQDYRSGLYSAQKKRVFVLAAIQSASQLWFRSIIGRIPQSRLAIILDEVHHAGAPGPTGNVLEINADFRIGLSATWRRYDDDQNGKLESFFMGNGSAVAYSYPLSQGIHDKILSPYKYIIHPVTLDPSDAEQLRSQLDEYEKQLEKINPRLSLSEGDQVIEKTPKKKWRTLTQLRNGWRSTLTRAVAKTDVALQIVDADYSSLNKCIIYCANKQHLDRTSTLMGQMHWGIEPYDSQVSDSIRKKIREKFARQRGDKPLFIGAIKCLDEGIDLPALDSAILVSSNKTEREWIQRRGRILRRYPGKEYSTIHDLVMLPYTSKSDAFRLTKAELGYVESELNRLEAFSADSLNKTETQALIKDLRELYGIT